MTIGELIKNSKLAYAESLILLSELLGVDKSHIVANPMESIKERSIITLWRQWHDRRLAGEPLEYIIGFKEFYGYRFLVTKDVLIPRPETEDLVIRAVNYVRRLEAKGVRNIQILEIGTGSGAVIVSLAKELMSMNLVQKVALTAVDISATALQVAKKNAKAHTCSDFIRFLQGNLFDPFSDDRFHIVLANLPYLPSEEAVENGFEPRIALDGGEKGDEIIKTFLKQAGKYIDDNGVVFYETYGGVVQELLFDTIS